MKDNENPLSAILPSKSNIPSVEHNITAQPFWDGCDIPPVRHHPESGRNTRAPGRFKKAGGFLHRGFIAAVMLALLSAGCGWSSVSDEGLLGVERITDELPIHDPDAHQVRAQREGDKVPAMRSLLSRERYWSEDGHLDVVVQLDVDEVSLDDVLSVHIEDTDGRALSQMRIHPLPGPNLVFYPKIPGHLAEGGSGEIKLTWTDGNGMRAHRSHRFRVEGYADVPISPGRVPVHISNDEQIVQEQVPFTVGVPFPRGALTDVSHLRLVDGDGTDIPLQVKRTARWSRYGSVKWALCDFMLDLEGQPRKLYLEYGAGVQREALPPIQVEMGNGFPIIDAGRVRIDEGVWFDPDGDGDYVKVLEEQALNGAFVVREDGRRYGLPVDDRYELEEHGTNKIVLRREGWYQEVDGEDEFCLYLTRYVIHRDSPLLRIFHSWIFTGDGNREHISNMGWQLPLAGPLQGKGFIGSFEEPSDWLEGSRLLQYDYEHFVVSDDSIEQEYPGGRATGVATAESEDIRLYFGTRDFWQNYPSELEFLDGSLWFHNWPRRNRPAGYKLEGELLTVSGDPSLPSAARHEYYEDGRLTLSEWSLNVIQSRFAHEGQLLNFRFPDAMAEHPIWTMSRPDRAIAESIVDKGNPETANAQGISRTEEMWLYLTPRSTEPEDAVRLLRGLNEQTVRAVADPSWVAASGAFFEIHPKDTEKYPEEERVHELLARYPGNIIERLGLYGMWIYGDIAAYPENLMRREPSLYRAFRKGHQGWPYTWVPFARSGDPDLLRLADAATRQMIDANYCHYYTDEVDEQSGPNRFRRIGRWHRGPIPWASRSGPSVRHYEEKCDFLWHSYYLTGYHRARDLALNWGEQTKQEENLSRRRPIPIRPTNRPSVNLLKSYLIMYEATFDPVYFNSSGGLRGHKRDLYEGGVRVPMIAKWPDRIETGAVSNYLWAAWDLMPTVAELSGAEVPGDIDGVSAVPVFFGKQMERPNAVYFEAFRARGRKDGDMGVAVRKGKWKAISNTSLLHDLELYDLERDPGETQNLASVYPEIVRELKNTIIKSRTQSKHWPMDDKIWEAFIAR